LEQECKYLIPMKFIMGIESPWTWCSNHTTYAEFSSWYYCV